MTVLQMQDYPRTGRHDWREEARQEGFEKAFGLIKSLEASSALEKRVAVEKWVNAGLLSEQERQVVAQFYGWERAP